MRGKTLSVLAMLCAPLLLLAAETAAPPPPDAGGLNAPGSIVTDTTPDDLAPPPDDPRDFEGVYLPGFGGGGGPPPGSAPGGPPGAGGPPGGGDPSGGGTLLCAPVERPTGAGGGMSNLWIVSPKLVVMVSEEDMDMRKIYLNAEHPRHLVPQPNGHSVGHWEGNVLKVDTIGYSDRQGKLSDKHMVETIQKLKVGKAWTLQREMTITSGGKTTTRKAAEVWRPDLRVYENVCEENFTRFKLVNGQIEVSPVETTDQEQQ